jgi:MATE family multidrug resistance protein
LSPAGEDRARSRVHSLAHDASRIAPLAWPVFVGQVAVLAFSTVDTVLVARHSALDLAALAVGSAAYITVFIGFMGVVLAVGPIVGRLFGAQQWSAAGHEVHQAVWIAIVLSIIGSLLLAFPAPFLWLAEATPEVAMRVRAYLWALALSLPAALLFTVYRGFNTAVSRPKAVMALQLAGLSLKVPLSALLVYGMTLPTPIGELRVPTLGVLGCGIATCIVMWLQACVALIVLRRDRFYARFELRGRGWHAPDRKSLRAQLRLGIPMGLSILIEVTGFSFMSLFIARLGTTPVAGHQIAANLAALLFMMPLALAHATSTLVAQRIGAGDANDARRLGWHGLQIAMLIAALVGASVYLARDGIVGLYTRDAVVIAAALPLVAWVALFHTADAAQAVASFVLRAYHVATLPLVIYASAIWGIGLAGGYLIAFDSFGVTPPALLGARGFWAAASAGLIVAALGLGAVLLWVLRLQQRAQASLQAPQSRARTQASK